MFIIQKIIQTRTTELVPATRGGDSMSIGEAIDHLIVTACNEGATLAGIELAYDESEWNDIRAMYVTDAQATGREHSSPYRKHRAAIFNTSTYSE